MTQYFTLNINIFTIKWKQGLNDLWDMLMIKKNRRIIAYVAKKLMDNDIFLVTAKNTILLFLSQLCFFVLMFKFNFWLTKQQRQWRLS